MRVDSVADGQLEGLVSQVSELSRRVFAFYEAEAERFDLTPPQASLLHTLDRPTPMREVAERQHCDASNLTGIVDRLEARGLIVRHTPAADRRVKELVLTEEGRRLHDHFAGLIQRLPGFSTLEDEERRELERLLGKALAGFPD
jgi:DNA-binding MarR family transcriptional regulator